MQYSLRQRSAIACSMLMLALFAVPLALAQHAGANFSPGPDMNTARMAHRIVTLPDGRVAVFGGHGTNFIPLGSAEAWSPISNTFTSLPMQYTHDGGAIAKLADGRYLLAGGCSNSLGVGYTNTAEIYDPAADSFTPTNAPMNFARTNCAAATLSGGKVLVMGTWYNASGGNVGDLYDPAAGTFSTTGTMSTSRSHPLILPTADNKAVVLGGIGIYGTPNYETVELYDSSSNTFTAHQANLLPPETGWLVTTIERPVWMQQLPDGKYLFMANRSAAGVTEYTLFTFDPATKQFAKIVTNPPLPDSNTASLHQPVVSFAGNRASILASLPPHSGDYRMYSVDLATYNLQTPAGLWTTPPAGKYLSYSGLAPLHDGRLFITGGTNSTGGNTNFNPFVKTYFASPILPAPPGLLIKMSQEFYDELENVVLQQFRLQNGGPNPAPVEVKWWLAVPFPGVPPISFLNIGFDGTLVLPPSFDADLGGGLVLFPGGTLPLGQYELNSRTLNPTTGQLLSEYLNTFFIE